MVDYTDPLMRDETYRRWKGGSKLADELRKFYTSPAALKRIAANNASAMGPGLPPKAMDIAKHPWSAKMNKRNRRMFGDRRGGNPNRLLLLQKLSRRSAEEEKSPSSQSGATL